MLHPAPQIKLWGGEDLEVLKEKHLLSKSLSKLTKNPPSLKHKILILQTHIFVLYKCMPSHRKSNRVNMEWNSSHKISIVHRIKMKKLGPQSTYKRYKVHTCMKTTSLYTCSIPSQTNICTHIRNSPSLKNKILIFSIYKCMPSYKKKQ